ncbi:MAG: hypothetical protein A3E07_03435 [Candidatus Wildermuthbacteria bacterium RIFCSPHIGHO2_12_FULL_45_9]|uniref:Uncharacterized protein n=1 Tax=Candidatus Wildermuthbacteria bacterium RIFCSPHIGHO2_02_FULL_45_25 TaxID=1802450 RepID=A0A1G2R1K2_9BACT|nr:MAG: hypothetical protein A2748_03570 [Candidatus Wildermuthbacteria bacterium RIFCSPHIGHO2_01_FULL_45_20]OHA66122.1 MAG: hypothetical protein A3C04_03740 [Candidatus Wildermuthbacteria bacterium RIFCSPHIGHO2_02_FULL_45_25]OHA71398.1 MAG: hypothetical protein A3E07_03435 [Candidatus Wildermuthbacteria bacterium RIFCSPHIGHO2_12_FULL_45_9]
MYPFLALSGLSQRNNLFYGVGEALIEGVVNGERHIYILVPQGEDCIIRKAGASQVASVLLAEWC